MMTKQLLAIAAATVILSIGITTTMTMTAFASNSGEENARNGWGDATSEEAKESGQELGEHSSDPNDDGPGNDEREGLGNTAETFTGQKNPDKLGDLLDCVDQDDEDDPETC
jgi:hypothetical protein